MGLDHNVNTRTIKIKLTSNDSSQVNNSQEELQSLSFLKNQIIYQYCDKFMSQQFIDLRSMLENEDFTRLPLPKDYDMWRDREESIIKLYCQSEFMFRNLEVYRSVQPLRKSSNSVGYLAQMAMSNPIRKLKFLSVDSAHQQQELHKLQFNFE